MRSAFNRWFKDSKVVDRRGRPLVVYHGSRSPWVTAFDPSFVGRGVVSGGIGWDAFWFSSSRENARYFTDKRPKKRADKESSTVYGEMGQYYVNITDRNGESIFQVGPYPTAEDARDSIGTEVDLYNKHLRKDTFVISAFLSLQNPLILEGLIPRGTEFEFARLHGHDGIIARDVLDGDSYGDVYVAFSPFQIKSATMNRGTYDPSSASIFD